SNQDGPWLLENVASPSIVGVLNTPTTWNGGSTPNPSVQVGSAAFQVNCQSLKRMQLTFDYKIVNASTNLNKQYFTNFIVEYAEANDAPVWQAVGGDSPPQTKYYRAATGFKSLT